METQRSQGEAGQGSVESSSPRGRGSAWRTRAVVALLVTLLVAAVVVIAVVGGDEAVDNPTAAEIAEDPSLYTGQRVIVTAPVETVFRLPPPTEDGEPRVAFTLATDADETLLVVGPAGQLQPVSERMAVRVEGIVQPFSVGGFASIFGTSGIPFGVAGERPVILATAISEVRGQAPGGG